MILAPICVNNMAHPNCYNCCKELSCPTARSLLVKRCGEITELGKCFQTYCNVSYDENEPAPFYSCKLCKSRIETIKKKTSELSSSFKQSKAFIIRKKRLCSPSKGNSPTISSPSAKSARLKSPVKGIQSARRAIISPTRNNEMDLDIHPLEDKVHLVFYTFFFFQIFTYFY